VHASALGYSTVKTIPLSSNQWGLKIVK